MATDRTDKHELAPSYVQGHSVRQTEVMRHGNKHGRDAVHEYEQDTQSPFHYTMTCRGINRHNLLLYHLALKSQMDRLTRTMSKNPLSFIKVTC